MALLIEKWIYNGRYAISVVHCWCHSWHIQSSRSVPASNASQVPLHLQLKGLLEGYTRMFPAEERECWWQECVYQVSLSKLLWSVWETWENVTGKVIELDWMGWDGFMWLRIGASGSRSLCVNVVESLQVSWSAGKFLIIWGSTGYWRTLLYAVVCLVGWLVSLLVGW